MTVLSQPAVGYHGLEIGLMGDRELVDFRALDDPALVEQARRGGYEAFEELVRRYRNDVFSLCYRYVSQREEAWDLSQEVFLKAHRGLKRFRGEAGFKTWLLRIAANRCKDYYKKRRLKTVALEDASASGDAPARDARPDQLLEAREIGEAIDLAMGELSEKHRLAFLLREYEGLSYEEMADVMQCSMGTVMSRLHHARKKLQKILLASGLVEGSVS
jgi:RNA polymerase sigma-70 factor (ECF subfamily)